MNLAGNTHLVSVVIPCYNQAQFLSDALNSLIQQTYDNWECYIVNDGSTDTTVTVAESFVKLDTRIQLINQTNKGLSAARNRGLDEVQGQFIQFLDADDVIEPDKFRIQVDKLLEINKDLALCYSDYRHCPEDNIRKTITHSKLPPARFVMDIPIHDLTARWETQMSIPVHCFLFKAVFFKDKAIRFDETLPNHEDWDCWMQIFKFNPIVIVTPKALAVYRLSNNSMCSNKRLMLQGFRKAIIKQKKIFLNDPIMQKILSEKLVELKKDYIDKLPPIFATRQHKKIFEIYNHFVPWRVQKTITTISKNLIYLLSK